MCKLGKYLCIKIEISVFADLIFLENTDVIFRVALALLTYHKDKLLACDGFEEIMNYLKTKLPAIDKPTLDKIMKQVSYFFVIKFQFF